MDEFRAACSWQSGQHLSDALACAVSQSVCARAEQEYRMWTGWAPSFAGLRLRNVLLRREGGLQSREV
jgi:hypothetical protein